ncbi:hypothetical protein [Nocardia sp. NPDC020380]|uniref:hypothetical protein n=1 Tax=Nocardia sp. NPDC020380 TaxID=3364309 RepID=UPI00379F34DC
MGYTLAFGSLMLSAEHVADVYGRRRAFLSGAVVFPVAVVIAFLALLLVLPIRALGRVGGAER